MPDQSPTTVVVVPVPDKNNVMFAGPRGPTRPSDVWLIEKLALVDGRVTPGH